MICTICCRMGRIGSGELLPCSGRGFCDECGDCLCEEDKVCVEHQCRWRSRVQLTWLYLCGGGGAVWRWAYCVRVCGGGGAVWGRQLFVRVCTYVVWEFVSPKIMAELKVLCTTIHYVVIKPDSRPDGTAIRDHAHVRVYTSSRERRCATNCESEWHPPRCFKVLQLECNFNMALADLLEAARTKRSRPAPGRRPPRWVAAMLSHSLTGDTRLT